MFADKQGGVFRWVGEAYGARTGFLAIWLQWIESTIWYPTVLTFGAVSIAFIGIEPTCGHDRWRRTRSSRWWWCWPSTGWPPSSALKGLGWVGKISKWGGMIGTIIPAGLLIRAGHRSTSPPGGHNQMDMSQGFFPDLTKFDNLVLASSIFLFYAGMEMMGIHVMDVNNPGRKTTRKPSSSVRSSRSASSCLGTFSLGFIIPAKDISLTQSLLIGFDNYFKLPAYVVGLARDRRRADVRRAGRRADLGRRSLEGYLHRGQGGLSASVLPEDQQATACSATSCSFRAAS